MAESSINLKRRYAVSGAIASLTAAALGGCAGGPGLPAKSGPADFVLVHGAWHGAWCWRRVSDRLLAAGHRVWAPTLTGLCDRAHLLSPAVNLQTHVDDVVHMVQWEDLQSIVLVGHSYGGMVVSGAAEALPGRVRSLVYLDAFVPMAGESVNSITGPAGIARLDQMAAPSNGLTLPPYPAKAFGIDDADAAWVDGKMTPQPYNTFKGSIASVAARDRIPKKTYVRAARFPSPAFDGFAGKYTGAPGWNVVTLTEGHDLMVTVPAQTAKLLIDAI